MPIQRFYASPDNTFTWPNGAIGHRSGGMMDCLGPYARVANVPVHGTSLHVTAYATGYADTFFSIPAACKIAGRYVGGFFVFVKDGDFNDCLVFRPLDKFKDRIPASAILPHGVQLGEWSDICRVKRVKGNGGAVKGGAE